MFSKFEYDGKLNPTFVEGPFELPFSSIRAYIDEPITPRLFFTASLLKKMKGFSFSTVTVTYQC